MTRRGAVGAVRNAWDEALTGARFGALGRKQALRLLNAASRSYRTPERSIVPLELAIAWRHRTSPVLTSEGDDLDRGGRRRSDQGTNAPS
jgi:hypothetical protein